MILVDNSQIVLSSIFSQYPNPETIVEKDPINLIRHITLNIYRHIKDKFGNEYGDLVICQDSSNYWRKDIFPYYKANRKNAKQDNQQYWDVIYGAMKIILTEVAENMPYKNIKVDRCEADDIIGVLTKNKHTTEKILIVSNDKDFEQLLQYPNVKLYSPHKKTMVECEDPIMFLFEQIVRGDSGDGIPNILSDDDTFLVETKRQKPVTAKRLAEFLNTIPQDMASGKRHFTVEAFRRNQKLIDLSLVPMNYELEILKSFNTSNINTHKMFNYFIEHKLTHLMKDLTSF
jgi:5'-3' exonuclease